MSHDQERMEAGDGDDRELDELITKLDRLGQEEQADLHRAQELDLAPGRAEEHLRQQVLARSEASTAGATAGPPRALLWLGAVAAAALLIFVFDLGSGTGAASDEVPGDTILGAGLELLVPRDRVDSFARFEWSAELPERGWYQVQVWGDSGNGYRFLTKSPRLTDPRWAPDPGELDTWPKKIRWKLEVYRGTGAGDLVDSDFAQAER